MSVYRFALSTLLIAFVVGCAPLDDSGSGDNFVPGDRPRQDAGTNNPTNDAGSNNPSNDAGTNNPGNDAGPVDPEESCGNGVIEGDEDCDDGNLEDGDGCSRDCVEEEEPQLDVEDQGALSVGDSQDADLVAALVHRYTVSIDALGAYAFGTRSERDTKCRLSADGDLLADDDDGGDGTNCRVETILEPGSYDFDIQLYSEFTPEGPYTAYVEVIEGTVCGDNTVQPGEFCDDGNTSDGDGCSRLCQREPLPDRHGDSADQATALRLESQSEGNIDEGDEDWFAITLPGRTVIRFFTTGEGKANCYLSDGQRNLSTDTGNNGDDGHCDTVIGVEPEGTYYLRLAPRFRPESGAYTLHVETRPGPVCGDNEIEHWEQCDDGNQVDGDGCSSICEGEDPHGNTQEAASGLTLGERIDASIDFGGDEDWFVFQTTNGGLHEMGTGMIEDNPTTDTRCYLIDADGNAVADNDDGRREAGGMGAASNCYIETELEANSSYFLRVKHYRDTGTGPYWLVARRIADAVCGNGELERGEQCDDGNDELGDGCDANCLREALPIQVGETIEGVIDPAGEEDTYGFTAPATGSYRIGTAGDNDTKCWLDDAGGNELNYNDDNQGLNCGFVHDLQEGAEYRIRVRFFSALRTGEYTLTVAPQ